MEQYERAIEDFNKAIELKPDYAEAYVNRGNSYLGLEEYERAIEDFDKAIKIDPKDVGAYHNRAIAIGQKTMQATLESYEKQLSSITDPAEINKRFQSRRKASEGRLRRFRKFTGGLFIVLIFATPILWFYVSGEIVKNGPECTEANCDNFSFITKHISISVTTILLLSPLIAALSYCNRNARIERHTSQECHVTPQPPRRRQYSDADGTF